MAKPSPNVLKPGSSQTRRYVLIGGVAVAALAFAIYMVVGGGDDGPKLDPKVSAKAEQMQRDLKAVNPDPPPAPPPLPPPAPGAPADGTPGGAPKSLRGKR